VKVAAVTEIGAIRQAGDYSQPFLIKSVTLLLPAEGRIRARIQYPRRIKDVRVNLDCNRLPTLNEYGNATSANCPTLTVE